SVVHARLRPVALRSNGVHKFRGECRTKRGKTSHGHPALRGRPFARSVRATRLSRPCRHRGCRGAQEPYPCRCGRTFAGVGAAPRPFIGVPPRIASFTGRAEELDRLDTILMRDKPAAVTHTTVGRVAVQGMGGVGKTALAIEYAHRFRGLYAAFV